MPQGGASSVSWVVCCLLAAAAFFFSLQPLQEQQQATTQQQQLKSSTWPQHASWAAAGRKLASTHDSSAPQQRSSSSSSSSASQQTTTSSKSLHDAAARAPLVSSSRRLLQEGSSSLAAQPGAHSSNDPEQAPAGDEEEWVQSLDQLAQLPAWFGASDSVRALSDADCPGCNSGACNSTDQGFRCSSCAGSLFVMKADGACGCPSGRYQPADQPFVCKDCDKGSFCLGGKYTGPGVPAKTPCSTFGAGLTTVGARSIGKRLCVNLPGYSYNVDATTGDPSATPCPADTYGPGLKKQRACVSCPTGYTTLGKTQQTNAQMCAIAAGYFQIAPGRVIPCPRGTWRAASGPLDPSTNCTSCVGVGVTTSEDAATSEKNCSDVVPGVFATSVVDGVVKATDKCPQKYYCPGGTARQSVSLTNIPTDDPTIVRCPRGMWTKGLGSHLESLCAVPPGHFATATATLECPNGEYRAGWAAPDEAKSCIKCSPDGSIQSMATEILTVLTLDGKEAITYVKSAVRSCYIVGGQGMVAGPDNTFKAVNCDNNNWGVSDNTFGLTTGPCKSCAPNLITSKNKITNPISSGYYKADNSTPPRGGFTAEGACVTAPGWGDNKGNVAPCEVGTWSAGDTREPCRDCPYGMTTGPNSTQSSEADCKIAPGYGWLRNSIQPCPKGTFNDKILEGNRTGCAPCPGGSTGTVEGATSKDTCNLCKAGFGGAGCTACGGTAANYGPGVRPIGTDCVACPAIGGADGGGGVGGYNFLDPKGGTNWFSPRVIAPVGGTRSMDCVGEFTQIADNAWNLQPQVASDWGSNPITVETFTDCVNLCTYDESCEFLQFDYSKEEQNCRLKVAPSLTTTNDLLCFKAVPSTDVGASSDRSSSSSSSSSSNAPGAASLTPGQAVRQLLSNSSSSSSSGGGQVGAKAVVASGKYTIWRDPAASRIGRQVDPPQGIPLSYDTCFSACDEDSECAGVFMTLTAVNVKPAACKLIYGDKTAGVFRRAMTRMRADAEHTDMYAIVGFQ